MKAPNSSVLILTHVSSTSLSIAMAGSGSYEGGQGSALHFLHAWIGYYGGHLRVHSTAMCFEKGVKETIIK